MGYDNTELMWFSESKQWLGKGTGSMLASIERQVFTMHGRVWSPVWQMLGWVRWTNILFCAAWNAREPCLDTVWVCVKDLVSVWEDSLILDSLTYWSTISNYTLRMHPSSLEKEKKKTGIVSRCIPLRIEAWQFKQNCEQEKTTQCIWVHRMAAHSLSACSVGEYNASV